MKDYFGSLQVHPHLFDEKVGHTHPIDLVRRIEFLFAADSWGDHFFLFQANDELLVNPADSSDFRYAKIFSFYYTAPLL